MGSFPRASLKVEFFLQRYWNLDSIVSPSGHFLLFDTDGYSPVLVEEVKTNQLYLQHF
jgi:hypothetical protein